MDYRKDAVKAHRYFSNLCGKGATYDDRNAPLVYNNKEATTVADKANFFCRHFAKTSTPARKKKKRVPLLHHLQSDDPYNRPFSAQELDFSIHSLDNKKAPDEDGIHAEFLKHSGATFRSLLLQHTNNTWANTVPSC
jgi:hypothetical protein